MAEQTNRSAAEMVELPRAEMEQVQGGGEAKEYSAVVFVGGWGASSYQYAFQGTSTY